MKPDPQDIEAEAAAWIARLHGSERTADDDRSFQRWICADPLHKTAYEGMIDAWDAAGHVKSDVLTRHRLSPRDGRSNWFGAGAVAVAAAVALVVLGTLFVRDHTLSTQVGERREITLEDGSRVMLNTATRITEQYSERQRLMRLESGEAFFQVARQPGRPFVVRTADGEITALGTSFSVRSESDTTEITLVDGQVRVDRGKEAHILKPGQRLILSSRTAPTIDRPAVEKVTAWRQGLIALDKTPLADAVMEMNRYSAVKLVVDPAIAAEIEVSGIFHAGDSRDFARGLAKSHGLRIVQGADKIILSPGG
jgi:transmembrane sensor